MMLLTAENRNIDRHPGVSMFSKLTEIFKSAIFPNQCLSCSVLFHIPEAAPCARDPFDVKADLRRIFTDVMSPFFCSTCISEFSPVESPVCTICGMIFKSREGEDHICGKCISGKNYFNTARSAGIHNNVLMTAIHHLKYNKKIQLAEPLSRILFAALVQHVNLHEIDLIIPVPLHKKRLRHRGFNQTHLLIKHWKNLPPHVMHMFSCPDINRDILVRSRHTPPQAQLDRKQRKINLKNAFDIKHPHDIDDKHILLVDDVFTTGATVDECAKVLLQSGAKRIDVFTLSRAVTGYNGAPAKRITF